MAMKRSVSAEIKLGGDTLIGNTGATFRAQGGGENQRILDSWSNPQMALGNSESW